MANQNVDLGNNQLIDLTMGKWLIVKCADDFNIKKLCSTFLANTVIEDYDIEELTNGLPI